MDESHERVGRLASHGNSPNERAVYNPPGVCRCADTIKYTYTRYLVSYIVNGNSNPLGITWADALYRRDVSWYVNHRTITTYRHG
jgi:hypothetical protein